MKQERLVPRRRASRTLAAPVSTQPFMETLVSDEKNAEQWACQCDAHLRRHPRCIASGDLQPALVHLLDYMIVGRAETCDLILDSKRTPQMLSRCHAILHKEDGVFHVVDQGAVNGVLVNDETVKVRRVLLDGDVLTFGVPTRHPEFDYIFETRPQTAIAKQETDTQQQQPVLL